MPFLPKQHKLSSLISLVLKILLTLGAFWLAFADVKWGDFKDIVTRQNPLGVMLAAGCIFIQLLMGALRWRYILIALSNKGKAVISYAEAFKIYYISVFFSNCLPGTIGGDIVRVWIAKSDNIPLSLSINSIVIDRLLALAGLVLVLLVMTPVLADLMHFNIGLVLLAFTAAVLIGSWLVIWIDHALAPFEHVRFIRWLRYFFNCLRLLIRKPVMSFYSLIAAALSHAAYGAAAYALASNMDIDVSFLTCLALMPLVMLAITIPISIGGWGVREVAMVSLFTLVGVADTASIAISLQMGMLNILVGLPAALLWITFKREKHIEKLSDTIPNSMI